MNPQLEPIYTFMPAFTDVVPLSMFAYADDVDVMGLSLIEFWCNWDLRDRSDWPLSDDGPSVVSAAVVAVLRELGSEATFVPVVLHAHPRWRGGKKIGVPWPRKQVPPAGLVQEGLSDSAWFAFDDAPGVDCLDWSNAAEDRAILGSVMAHPTETGVVQPHGGFSPLFAVEHSLGATFYVTSEVRERLRARGVRGIDFGKPIPVRAAPLYG